MAPPNARKERASHLASPREDKRLPPPSGSRDSRLNAARLACPGKTKSGPSSFVASVLVSADVVSGDSGSSPPAQFLTDKQTRRRTAIREAKARSRLASFYRLLGSRGYSATNLPLTGQACRSLMEELRSRWLRTPSRTLLGHASFPTAGCAALQLPTGARK